MRVWGVGLEVNKAQVSNSRTVRVFGEYGLMLEIHFGKSTWNLKRGPLKRTVVCRGPPLRFHISFPECKYRQLGGGGTRLLFPDAPPGAQAGGPETIQAEILNGQNGQTRPWPARWRHLLRMSSQRFLLRFECDLLCRASQVSHRHAPTDWRLKLELPE